MNRLPLSKDQGGGRFDGFDVLAQSKYWDQPTQDLILSRLDTPSNLLFFSQSEAAVASTLFDLLLGQNDEPRIPILNMVDRRLATGETDGWHFEDMGTDETAWHLSLEALDNEAELRAGDKFAKLPRDIQQDVLQTVFNSGERPWHGLRADRVWGLWTRYACSAFYSHPWAWQEIGFAGPAYPRGYKNLGVDRREPFEVRDSQPDEVAGKAPNE